MRMRGDTGDSCEGFGLGSVEGRDLSRESVL